MISNLLEHDGIKYSRVIQKIAFKEPIDQVFTGPKHSFALSKSGEFYFWGQNQSGLALETTN